MYTYTNEYIVSPTKTFLYNEAYDFGFYIFSAVKQLMYRV